MDREVHYFTFGMGQSMEGHCQPIVADNADQARREMVKHYGYKWSMQYSQQEYMEAARKGLSNERLLDPLYAEEKPTDGNQ